MFPTISEMMDIPNVYVTAILVVLITVILLIFWSRRRYSRRGILLVGLCDSGKTLMFSRLLHDKFVNTYTSIKENIGQYVVKNEHLKIIDIPGHDTLHDKFFDQYKNVAGGIVYVVDSATFQKNIQDVAEFLYSLLTDPIIRLNRPKFLILCNKQDHPTSASCKDVQNLLEKEINTLRYTKSSQLKSTHEVGKKQVLLGKQEKDFEFSHINIFNVSFGEAAALNGDANRPAKLDHLKDWLESF